VIFMNPLDAPQGGDRDLSVVPHRKQRKPSPFLSR
jgi:hypothetical protein